MHIHEGKDGVPYQGVTVAKFKEIKTAKNSDENSEEGS
jgi:hypothetical protein